MYKVLKDFKGSPDGRFVINYTSGETVDLTESLAAVAVAEGWVAPVDQVAEPQGEASSRKPKKARQA